MLKQNEVVTSTNTRTILLYKQPGLCTTMIALNETRVHIWSFLHLSPFLLPLLNQILFQMSLFQFCPLCCCSLRYNVFMWPFPQSLLLGSFPSSIFLPIVLVTVYSIATYLYKVSYWCPFLTKCSST